MTDLRSSVVWYRALLDLRVAGEFVEGGELRGVQLVDPDGAFGIALRDKRYCAGQPDFAGFDLFAIEADSLAALDALATRCNELGVTHGGVLDHSDYGANLDIPDPDGTVLRFLANNVFNPGHFLGIEFGANDRVEIYDVPRFTA